MSIATGMDKETLIFQKNSIEEEIEDLEVSKRKNLSHIYGMYLDSTLAKKKSELDEMKAEMKRRGIPDYER